MMRHASKRKRAAVAVLLCLCACGARVSEPESDVDIPADIYEEEVWNTADAEVRVAALRRDVDAEMARLRVLPDEDREPQSQKLLELMSSLRAEWGKLEEGREAYAELEAEVEVLLEG